MALSTVQDYVDGARVLLLDQVEPFRYSNADLVTALNYAILEARRLRPDLLRAYLGAELPEYSADDMGETVEVDQQYRVAFLYYVCGQAQLRDDENNQDSRASALMNKFNAVLTTTRA